MTNFRGQVIRSDNIAKGPSIINSLSTSKDDAVNFTDYDNFFNALNAKDNVASIRASKEYMVLLQIPCPRNGLFHRRRKG